MADQTWPAVHRQDMLVRYPERMTLALPSVRRPRLHVHRFHRAEDGPIGTLYACRCGSVRPGF
ncbi:hypothetical protein SAMN05660485_03680 [Blastococcus fimeti]|nr:hypothetical protein SAMN05660485_03680 [Blastococcus fimeti]